MSVFYKSSLQTVSAEVIQGFPQHQLQLQTSGSKTALQSFSSHPFWRIIIKSRIDSNKSHKSNFYASRAESSSISREGPAGVLKVIGAFLSSMAAQRRGTLAAATRTEPKWDFGEMFPVERKKPATGISVSAALGHNDSRLWREPGSLRWNDGIRRPEKPQHLRKTGGQNSTPPSWPWCMSARHLWSASPGFHCSPTQLGLLCCTFLCADDFHRTPALFQGTSAWKQKNAAQPNVIWSLAYFTSPISADEWQIKPMLVKFEIQLLSLVPRQFSLFNLSPL